MDTVDKLRLIRDAIQQDVGNRGLARDPTQNLFTACADDFTHACQSIADHPSPCLDVVTGFFIPTATPPAFETDGPLGAIFLLRAFRNAGIPVVIGMDPSGVSSIVVGMRAAGIEEAHSLRWSWGDDHYFDYISDRAFLPGRTSSHLIAVERPGPSTDGRLYSMRGSDVSRYVEPAYRLFTDPVSPPPNSIGIGDGGNEIGMGKIPHETIVKNIPNGDLIHCRVPTDHLIVAGVSNWGAYALAAGVALLRDVELPDELFDPDREHAILRTIVDAGPLVDGVSGQQTATVDGLTWEQYIAPLVRIREIMKL